MKDHWTAGYLSGFEAGELRALEQQHRRIRARKHPSFKQYQGYLHSRIIKLKEKRRLHEV